MKGKVYKTPGRGSNRNVKRIGEKAGLRITKKFKKRNRREYTQQDLNIGKHTQCAFKRPTSECLLIETKLGIKRPPVNSEMKSKRYHDRKEYTEQDLNIGKHIRCVFKVSVSKHLLIETKPGVKRPPVNSGRKSKRYHDSWD